MPSISFNLASQRMNTGGAPGGLSPVLLDGSIGANTRAPRVNVNAGNTQWSNMAVPEVRPDRTIQQIAEAGMSMTRAALEYQDRVDTAEASQRLLDYEDQLMAIASGDQGYLYTSGQEAVNTYQSVAAKIKELAASAISGAGDAVKAKMLPKLHQVSSNYISKSAEHKAQQQTVWEKNIQQNSLEQERTKMLQASNDPAEFNAQLVETLESVDVFYAAQPELAEKTKRALKEDAYLSAAAQQADLNNFALAAEYVMQGVASNVDPQKTAAALSRVESAMLAHNSRISTAARQNAADHKAQEEIYNHNVLRSAMSTGNRSAIGSIVDPVEQIKYEKLFDDFVSGRPSDPGADIALQALASEYTHNPDAVLFQELPVYVSAADRQALHTRMLSDRKLNITQQRKEANAFVTNMISLPPGLAKPSATDLAYQDDEAIAYATMERAVADQRAYWSSRFNQALDDSRTNPKENATTAVLRVKSEMLQELEAQGLSKQNVSMVRIPEASLRAIPGLNFGGLLSITKLAPRELGEVDLDKVYKYAELDLLAKYGLDPANPAEVAAKLMEDSAMRRDIKRDKYQLYLQKQYILQTKRQGATNAE